MAEDYDNRILFYAFLSSLDATPRFEVDDGATRFNNQPKGLSSIRGQIMSLR